jgi:hypothetical protein
MLEWSIKTARLSLVSIVAVMLFAGWGGGSDVERGGDEPKVSKSEAPWPRPSHSLERARLAGLEPERQELLDYHVHAHLDVFVDGELEAVPLGIGLDVSQLERRTVDGEPVVAPFGQVCDRPCVSPLHTHDESGIIHTESAEAEPNTLGQLFVEWGVRMTKRCVGGYCKPDTPIAVYLDGERFRGDPRDIELLDQLEIALVIGTPPESIPSTGDFSRA